MFLIAESNANMICYRLSGDEQLDPLTHRMLCQTPLPGFPVPGVEHRDRNTCLIRLPTAGTRPLTDWLHEQGTADGTVRVLQDLPVLLGQAAAAMIPPEEILLEASSARVRTETGTLVLLCLPVLRGTGRESIFAPGRNPLQEFCRMALAAGLSGTEDAGEREALCTLLRELDRPDLSPETLAEGLSSWTIRIKSSGPSPERKEKMDIFLKNAQNEVQNPDLPAAGKAPDGKPGFRNKLHRLLHPPRTPEPEPTVPSSEDWLLFAPPDGPKDGSARQVRVLTVRRTGVSVTLDDEPLVAGSDGDVAEILLPDNPDAAREHCRIFPERGHYYVEDLNTETGTFHNGERIRMWEPERLEPADIIRIGGDEIVYSERYPG